MATKIDFYDAASISADFISMMANKCVRDDKELMR